MTGVTGLEEDGAPCRAQASWCHSILTFAPFFRVVSDNCYPFSGREQNEASTSPRCMMHSRAMGRGKRQATSRCPNSQVDSNDIYQVTPAYRLGSDVSLKRTWGEGRCKGWGCGRLNLTSMDLPPQEKEIMKELMENGPVQGKYPSPLPGSKNFLLEVGHRTQRIARALGTRGSWNRSAGSIPHSLQEAPGEISL